MIASMFTDEKLERVDWCAVYMPATLASPELADVFEYWWRKNKNKPSVRKQPKEHWRAMFQDYVHRLRESIGTTSSGRCPDCGNIVNTPRCLACDLESGLVQ